MDLHRCRDGGGVVAGSCVLLLLGWEWVVRGAGVVTWERGEGGGVVLAVHQGVLQTCRCSGCRTHDSAQRDFPVAGVSR